VNARRKVLIGPVLLLAFAAPASAQTAAGEAYNPPDTLGVETPAPSTAQPIPASLPSTTIPIAQKAQARAGGANLPLTGLQIAIVLGAGGALVLLGVGMHRTRPREPGAS
jgi:hypothetical protein